MFHDILPEAFSYFKANLTLLKQRTNVISLDDFFAGKLSIKRINVAITFDDGYKSWITYAIPVLKELGLPATFFVSSGFVGLSKEEEAEFTRSQLFLTLGPRNITGGLSANDVRMIVEEGFGVGGHTLNHSNLLELRDNTHVVKEISEDKSRLEKIAGVEIEYFAYPFGAHDNPKIDLVEVLIKSGYKGAVTTVPGLNTGMTNPYRLHRELTRASMPGRVFNARVFGNYDAVCFFKERARKLFHSA